MPTRFILDSAAKFLKSLVYHINFQHKNIWQVENWVSEFHFEAYVASLFCLGINFGWKIHF